MRLPRRVPGAASSPRRCRRCLLIAIVGKTQTKLSCAGEVFWK